MFTVGVEKSFWASHRLGGHGEKGRRHGHNWRVAVAVSGRPGESAMVMDFELLGSALEGILRDLDNAQLEEMEYFRRNRPSAEMVARYVHEKLREALPAGVSLEQVKVSEGPGCWAAYSA
jgi:6-pyruvoyl tetrahydropterin synthase/QueD family protein